MSYRPAKNLPDLLNRMRDKQFRFVRISTPSKSNHYQTYYVIDEYEDVEDVCSELTQKLEEYEEAAPGTLYRLTVKKTSKSHGEGSEEHEIRLVDNTPAVSSVQGLGGLLNELDPHSRLRGLGYVPASEVALQKQIDQLQFAQEKTELQRQINEQKAEIAELKAEQKEFEKLVQNLESKLQDKMYQTTESIKPALEGFLGSALSGFFGGAKPAGLGGTPTTEPNEARLLEALRQNGASPAEITGLANNIPALLKQMRAYTQQAA